MTRDGSGTAIPAGSIESAAPLVRLLTGQADAHDADLVRTLAMEVIARLEHKARAVADRPVAAEIGALDVKALCDALLSTDETRAAGLVQQAADRGVDVDLLHLGYLGEAARLMGQRWQEDLTSSAEVVIGAGRIYRILRQLRERFLSARPLRPEEYHAVFASVPGETHTLGLTMAADYMRRRGWEVDVRSGLDHAALVDQIGLASYSIIGLSASTSAAIFPLTRLIVALRISNPRASIVVGGSIVEAVPDLVSLVDADDTVRSVEEAVAHFEALLHPAPGLNVGKL